MANKDICQICGEGKLNHISGKNTVEYKGKFTELDIQFSVCDACGSEQADAEELRNNKRAMVAFKKQVDGLLTGIEVRKLRERLGISQIQAAHIFGGGPVAFSKYESDDVTQSESMDKLLRLALDLNIAFENLASKVGVRIDKEELWTKIEYKQPLSTILRVISTGQPESEEAWYVPSECMRKTA